MCAWIEGGRAHTLCTGGRCVKAKPSHTRGDHYKSEVTGLGTFIWTSCYAHACESGQMIFSAALNPTAFIVSYLSGLQPDALTLPKGEAVTVTPLSCHTDPSPRPARCTHTHTHLQWHANPSPEGAHTSSGTRTHTRTHAHTRTP